MHRLYKEKKKRKKYLSVEHFCNAINSGNKEKYIYLENAISLENIVYLKQIEIN